LKDEEELLPKEEASRAPTFRVEELDTTKETSDQPSGDYMLEGRMMGSSRRWACWRRWVEGDSRVEETATRPG